MPGHGILSGKKTYVTAILGVLGAVAGYLTGDLEMGNAINVIYTAVTAAFLRSGIKKVEG